jgi:hypothetical protein
MRVLVCGGRNYNDKAYAFAFLDVLYSRRLYRSDEPLVIIHGAATGADSLGKLWAATVGAEVLPFPAAWTDLSHPDAVIRTRRDGTQYDALAGHRRNQHMIDEGKPDLAVAFPSGTGTADMVRRLKQANIEVIKCEGRK